MTSEAKEYSTSYQWVQYKLRTEQYMSRETTFACTVNELKF